jgi:hypothetical protein
MDSSGKCFSSTRQRSDNLPGITLAKTLGCRFQTAAHVLIGAAVAHTSSFLFLQSIAIGLPTFA